MHVTLFCTAHGLPLIVLTTCHARKSFPCRNTGFSGSFVVRHSFAQSQKAALASHDFGYVHDGSQLALTSSGAALASPGTDVEAPIGLDNYHPVVVSNTFMDMKSASSLSPDSALMLSSAKKGLMRKPRGYWKDTTNLCAELVAFCDAHGVEKGFFPTQHELLRAKRVDLMRALQRPGARDKVMQLLKLRTKRKPNGYWSNLEILRKELLTLAAELGLPVGVMPNSSLLIRENRSDVFNAVIHAGGFNVVARTLGLKLGTLIRSEDFVPATEQETGPFSINKNLQYKKEENDLGLNGWRDCNEGELLHTGTSSLRVRSRKASSRKPAGWWNWRRFEKDIRAFAEENCNGNMPTQSELISAGRYDIMNALRKHGGVDAVARRAALPMRTTRRPRGHWTDKAVLQAEILSYMTRNGHPGLMPRREELLRAGREDLCYAIRKHGGFLAIAAELHLVWHGPSCYWRSFRNLQKRLFAWTKRSKEPGKMPSYQELYDCGRHDLIFGMALHGGFMNVAARMGLRVEYQRREEGYWTRPENVQNELEAFINTQPLEFRDIMPSSVQLVQAGRWDLANIIRDHGGWVYYARRLGLRYIFERRSQGFWQSEKNVKNELIHYISCRYGDWDIPGKLKQGSVGEESVHPGCMGYEVPEADKAFQKSDTKHSDSAVVTDAVDNCTQNSGHRKNSQLSESSSWANSFSLRASHIRIQRKRRGVGEGKRARSMKHLTTIPSIEMLKRDGRSDIAFAIQRYQGGEAAFAARHGYCIASDSNMMRPYEDLSDWRLFASEFLLWLQTHGCVGIMPARTDLIRTGRNDLRYAIYSHGGSRLVARRLELVLTTDKDWLAKWLGLQAGRMGLRILLLPEKWKPSVLTGEEKLPRTFRGDRRALRLINLRERQRQIMLNSGKHRRSSVRKVNRRRMRASLYKLSEKEFQALRERYKHIPADDIIAP